MLVNKGAWHKPLAYKFQTKLGLGPRSAEFASNIIHEGISLGMFGSAIDVTTNLAADYVLDDKQKSMMYTEDHPQYVSKDYSAIDNVKGFASSFAHHMTVGTSLGIARHIPWGKAVEWSGPFGAVPMKGSLADTKNIFRSLHTYFRKAENLSPKAKQTALSNFYVGSGKDLSIFKRTVKYGDKKGNIINPGITKGMLSKSKLNEKDIKAIDVAYKNIQAKMPKTAYELAKDIPKDLLASAPRALTGSFIMNFEYLYDQYKTGNMLTEKYPMQQLVHDMLVGYLYMKRGKTLKGNPALAEYYSMGIDGKGTEVSKMVKFMDVLGYKDADLATLRLHNSLDIDQSLSHKIMMPVESSKEMSAIENFIVSNTVSNESKLKTFSEGKRSWNSLILDRMAQLNDVKKNLETRGLENTKEYTDITERIRGIEEQKTVAEVLINRVLGDKPGIGLTPMDNMVAAEAFLDKISEFTINREKLTPSNVGNLIEQLQESSAHTQTQRVTETLLEFIKEQAIFLGDKPATDNASGRIILDKGLRKRIELMQTATKNGEFVYEQNANLLLDVLDKAKEQRWIKYSDKDNLSEAPPTDPEVYSKLKDHWWTSTENMHNWVFAKPGGPDSWRRTVPSWHDGTKELRPKEEFLDPDILMSTPIWAAINMGARRFVNKSVYDAFTNVYTESGISQEIIRRFGNSKEIRVAVDVDKGELPLSQSEELIRRNISDLYKTLNPSANPGFNEVTRGGFDKLKDMLRQEFGNIFETPGEFQQVVEYANMRSTSEMLNAQNATTGVKKALHNFVQEGNPLSSTEGNKLRILDSSKIKEFLFKEGTNIDNPADKFNLELIDLYISTVERPIKSSLKNDRITFDKESNLSGDVFDKNEIRNILLETIALADRTSMLDVARFQNALSEVDISIAH